MDRLEVTQGDTCNNDRSRSRRRGNALSSCFPVDLFVCCPGPVKAFIPRTWHKVQDWTHLSLILGVVSSIALIVTLTHKGFDCTSFFCIKEVLGIIFIVPCMLYFIRTIGQYDDRLQAKQRDAKEQKEQLTKAYNNLLSDMDGLLTKSAESSAGLAERSFESKRRDFQRFLERAKSRYSEIFSGSKGESEKLLKEFKRFVENWLHVFEECSIDPLNTPKRVVTFEELDDCKSIAEVCDKILPRLRNTEVRFISIQRDQDTQMLKKSRDQFRRMTAAPDPAQLRALENGGRSLTTELSGSFSGRRGAGPRLTWISFGSYGCHCGSSQTADRYPYDTRCGCCRLVVLSREHGMLLAGFFVGFLIIGLELLHGPTHESEEFDREKINPFIVALVALNQICLAVLLIRFEEIDVIQQLEREVKQLQKKEQEVQQQREKMHQFWSNAQQLTELWLYRTVPRLDLYKEVHSLLEDADTKDINLWMLQANDNLQAIEDKLGPDGALRLANWRNEGALGIESKKHFGKIINQACQEQEFDQIRRKLAGINDDIKNKDMFKLQNGSDVVVIKPGSGKSSSSG